MANPQPTPFVQFSKELFDALLLSGMPATHKEIVLSVIRRTYGNHGQKSAAISQSLLQRMTGRHRNSIQRGLGELREAGVLKLVQGPSFGTPAVWGLNKDYEAWGRWSVSQRAVDNVDNLAHEDVSLNKGEAHEDVLSLPHYSVLSEAHCSVPIEDKRDKRDREELRAEEPACGKPTREAPTAGACPWVAKYVDARKAAGNPASRRDCEIFGAKAKTLGDIDEHVMTDTIQRMIERNKGPTLLPNIYGDVKRESDDEIFAMQVGGARHVR